MLNLTAAENAVETPSTETTDAELIAKARGLNKAMDRHFKKGIEAFWMLGESLATLYKRRHLQADGRWSSVLKEIGIGTTTDNHARNLFKSCDFADLGNFKNKTQALRSLGIITEKLAPPSSTACTPEVTSETSTTSDTSEVTSEASTALLNATDGREPQADAIEKKDAPGAKDRPASTNAPEQEISRDDDGLTTLSRLAARLESLANEGLGVSEDQFAQLERIVAAFARLKEVALVAA